MKRAGCRGFPLVYVINIQFVGIKSAKSNKSNSCFLSRLRGSLFVNETVGRSAGDTTQHVQEMV